MLSGVVLKALLFSKEECIGVGNCIIKSKVIVYMIMVNKRGLSRALGKSWGVKERGRKREMGNALAAAD